MTLRDEVAQVLAEAVQMRRYLHSHPELSGQETGTRAYICEKLQQWGIPYRLCQSNMGVVADMGQGSPCVALRVDTDALPVQEQTGLPFASQTPGVMHACGHDVHTAALLAVAKLLKSREETLKGTVRLLFQPAEETEGGAEYMIAEGCLENPRASAVLGFHVDPTMPVGYAAFCQGTMNAAATDFTLRVQGKGCHGAHPEQGVDAVVAAAQVVTALQSVVSRNLAPTESGVVTIGTIHGGTKENIIASQVTMTGTIRALTPQIQARLKNAVRLVAENTAAAFGAKAEITMEDLCPALINDDSLTDRMYALARGLLGKEQTVMMRQPSLGADDFAFFSDKVAGCYFNVGAFTEGVPGQALHSPTFIPHEGAMETAILLLSAGAMDYLG